MFLKLGFMEKAFIFIVNIWFYYLKNALCKFKHLILISQK
jgi:hypothetical protein